MKKTLIILALFLVLMSAQVGAEIYWESEFKEDVIKTNNLNYNYEKGEFEYQIQLNDNKIRQHSGSFFYGLSDKSELYGQFIKTLSDNNDITSMNIKLKNIYKKTDNWLFGSIASIYTDNYNNQLEFNILADRYINKKTLFHNNLKVDIDNFSFKKYDAGISYLLNNNSAIKAAVSLDQDYDTTIKGAYKNIINNKTTYIGGLKYDKDIEFSNILNYQFNPTFKLQGRFVLKDDNNKMSVKGWQDINKNITITAEMENVINKTQSLTAGVNYSF